MLFFKVYILKTKHKNIKKKDFVWIENSTIRTLRIEFDCFCVNIVFFLLILHAYKQHITGSLSVDVYYVDVYIVDCCDCLALL